MNALKSLIFYFAWTRRRGSIHVLSLIFGVTVSVSSLFIRFGRRILIQVLCNDGIEKAVVPSDAEIDEFKGAFRSRHSARSDVFCVAEVLKLMLQQSGGVTIQNQFFNGWMHDHYVSNLFIFTTNVRMIASTVNTPRCLHNSTIAGTGTCT